MNVLVLNCESSTVKFRLLAITATGGERRLAGTSYRCLEESGAFASEA